MFGDRLVAHSSAVSLTFGVPGLHHALRLAEVRETLTNELIVPSPRCRSPIDPASPGRIHARTPRVESRQASEAPQAAAAAAAGADAERLFRPPPGLLHSHHVGARSGRSTLEQLMMVTHAQAAAARHRRARPRRSTTKKTIERRSVPRRAPSCLLWPCSSWSGCLM